VGLAAQLKAKYRKQKPYLLMDNLSVHRSLDLRPILERHFRLLFQPAYSCRVSHALSIQARLIRCRAIHSASNSSMSVVQLYRVALGSHPQNMAEQAHAAPDEAGVHT
jgi:hypothetical protein